MGSKNQQQESTARIKLCVGVAAEQVYSVGVPLIPWHSVANDPQEANEPSEG
jgi:hypothetical protein